MNVAPSYNVTLCSRFLGGRTYTSCEERSAVAGVVQLISFPHVMAALVPEQLI